MALYSQTPAYPAPEYDPTAAAAAAAQVPGAYPYAAPQYPAGTAPPAQPYPYGPPQGYAASYTPQFSQPDELRTIFVTGFPTDVRERELNNLLRFLPGYEASQLHQPGQSPQAQGFALFDSAASASNALRSLANLVFEEGATLRCELARKNMYIKDDVMTKRSRYEGAYGGYGAIRTGGYAGPPGQSQAARTASANARDNPPCSTLFVGNLGDGTSEEELRQLFSALPGFRQVKLNHGARGITCFVEYEDVLTAMEVHKKLQGTTLQSSDRGPVRIQYSRNPFFGKKREREGGMDGSSAPFNAASLIKEAEATIMAAGGSVVPSGSAVNSLQKPAEGQAAGQQPQQGQQERPAQA